MAGDFNLFTGWEFYLKNKFLAKLIEFKGTYELCDIWRIRNTNSKRYTFTQKNSSAYVDWTIY